MRLVCIDGGSSYLNPREVESVQQRPGVTEIRMRSGWVWLTESDADAVAEAVNAALLDLPLAEEAASELARGLSRDDAATDPGDGGGR